LVIAAAFARYVAEGGDWRKSYYMPTRADAAIMAMRKWMDKHAGGGIPWPEHLQVTLGLRLAGMLQRVKLWDMRQCFLCSALPASSCRYAQTSPWLMKVLFNSFHCACFCSAWAAGA
jgi:hypothetical protein